MSDEIKKCSNPYVFPQSNDNNVMHDDYNGMMLRDYFAAKVLTGILSATGEGSWKDIGVQMTSGKSIVENIAIYTYEVADAMLKERLK